MDTSSGPKAPMVTFSPGLSGLEVGPKSEILDMIKIRKAQLKFRRTVLLRREKFRMRLSEVQGEFKYEELIFMYEGNNQNPIEIDRGGSI